MVKICFMKLYNQLYDPGSTAGADQHTQKHTHHTAKVQAPQHYKTWRSARERNLRLGPLDSLRPEKNVNKRPPGLMDNLRPGKLEGLRLGTIESLRPGILVSLRPGTLENLRLWRKGKSVTRQAGKFETQKTRRFKSQHAGETETWKIEKSKA